MRVAAALAVVGLSGVLAASALTHGTRAANPKLTARVGPGASISLKDSNGTAVTSLVPGTYDIDVNDTESTHNFDLKRPDGTSERNTSISGTGTETWTVTLTGGTWTFVCDAHPTTMNGNFTVGTGSTSSSGTTGTTSTTATTATPGTTSTTGATETTRATTASDAGTTTTTGRRGVTGAKARRCVVPRLVGKRLATARSLVRRAGCRMGRVTRAYSAKIRNGRVLAQRPRAGRHVARGTRVHVVVSR
jgi:PASTA domain-containing protein